VLVKDPLPAPSDELASLIVGSCSVLQQTPLAVTSAPPSEVIFPPETALLTVTPLIGTVDKTGRSGFFLHEITDNEPVKRIIRKNVEYEMKLFFILREFNISKSKIQEQNISVYYLYRYKIVF
jgi:hypothetical protein